MDKGLNLFSHISWNTKINFFKELICSYFKDTLSNFYTLKMCFLKVLKTQHHL